MMIMTIMKMMIMTVINNDNNDDVELENNYGCNEVTAFSSCKKGVRTYVKTFHLGSDRKSYLWPKKIPEQIFARILGHMQTFTAGKI